MSATDYEELFRLFDENKVSDTKYKQYLNLRNVLDDLKSLKEDDTKAVVMGFLHKWGKMARVVGRKKAPALTKVLRDLAPYFDAIKEINLEFLDLRALVLLRNQRMTVADVIKRIFNELYPITKSTATSKAIHIINPNLFVMWDTRIRECAGCFGNAEGYLNFMMRQHVIAREALDSYKRDHRCSDGEAKKQIEDKYEGMPFTKLLDLYNYKKIREK